MVFFGFFFNLSEPSAEAWMYHTLSLLIGLNFIMLLTRADNFIFASLTDLFQNLCSFCFLPLLVISRHVVGLGIFPHLSKCTVNAKALNTCKVLLLITAFTVSQAAYRVLQQQKLFQWFYEIL